MVLVRAPQLGGRACPFKVRPDRKLLSYVEHENGRATNQTEADSAVEKREIVSVITIRLPDVAIVGDRECRETVQDRESLTVLINPIDVDNQFLLWVFFFSFVVAC